MNICIHPNCDFVASTSVGSIHLCGAHASGLIATIEVRRTRRLTAALTTALQEVAAA